MIQSVKKIKYEGKVVSYLLTLEGGEKWGVPLNEENNRHYQEIQEWVAEGNTIEEAD